MAREYGRLLTSAWKDPDWQALDPYYQGVFGALLSYRGISWCGVIDYIPKRLIEFSKSMTLPKLRDSIDYLTACDFTYLDSDTDELLVRTFIRHDGVMKMLNVGKAMARAFDDVQSDKVREVIVTELGKLYVDQPKLKGWEGVEDKSPELMEQVLLIGKVIPS